MKKRESIHSFVLLMVLVIAIGAIFLYSNLKFTGYVINPLTNETCNGDWTNVTGECINGTQTITWTGTNTTNCDSAYTITHSCEMPIQNQTCTESWVCGNWTTCSNSTQTRTCTDSANCNVTINSTLFPVSQSCNSTIVNTTNTSCAPTTCSALGKTCGNWANGTCGGTLNCGTCGSDYTCSSGTCKIKEDTPSPKCGNGNCGMDETCSSCPTDCGVCSSGNGVTDCIPNLDCGEWESCIDGTQQRACTDLSQCDPTALTSTESQSCVSETTKPAETCSDGIKNQDETGIDCGGSCNSCSIFTMVGSVISGPVLAGKDFLFGSTARIIISTSLLLLLIGGFITFKILSDRGFKFKELANEFVKLKDKLLNQKFGNLTKSENSSGY
jgi:hypothetical protein